MTGTLDAMAAPHLGGHLGGHTVTGSPTGPAAHAARPAVPLGRVLTTSAAGAVLVGALALGVWAWVGSSGPAGGTPTSARLITVTPAEHP